MSDLLTLTELANRPLNGRTLKRKSLADLRDKGIIQPCANRIITPAVSEDLYNPQDVETALSMKLPNGVHYDTARIAKFWIESAFRNYDDKHRVFNQKPKGIRPPYKMTVLKVENRIVIYQTEQATHELPIDGLDMQSIVMSIFGQCAMDAGRI